MRTQTFFLRPKTAFGTHWSGDTLFGQLCWATRYIFGQHRLQELLKGYTQGKPFIVVSDVFPKGYVPLPLLPGEVWTAYLQETDLKALKKRCWVPIERLNLPLADWQHYAVTPNEIKKVTLLPQPHNTINRLTGTTGTDMFAPYTMTQVWFEAGSTFELHVVFDSQRISEEEILQLLKYVGLTGFGRDATIGLGKFSVKQGSPLLSTFQTEEANAYLSLGPCAPQGLNFHPEKSFWQVTTRFGRHGDIKALADNPFKKPILLARAGSVFWPNQGICASQLFIGQGLGGKDAPISWALDETVHQGYCPVLPIQLPDTAYQA